MIEIPKGDIEFFERKISRLETELIASQEELATVYTKLRTAEDFRIKYEVLLRKAQEENNKLKI